MKKKAQSLIELAMVMPMLLLVLLVCLQYGILFMTFLSVMNTGRDAGRWVAVHPHNPDTTTEGAIKSRLPANLDPNKLTVTFSPACPALASGAKCANRNPGDRITTTLTYNAAALIFFPAQFGLAGLSVPIAQGLPAYTVWTMAEPADPGA